MTTHVLTLDMVPDSNDPERNHHRGRCSCRGWGTTRTWQSAVKTAWNMHMAEEYRTSLRKIATLINDSDSRVDTLAWEPDVDNTLKIAQTLGVTLDDISLVLEELDPSLFDD